MYIHQPTAIRRWISSEGLSWGGGFWLRLCITVWSCGDAWYRLDLRKFWNIRDMQSAGIFLRIIDTAFDSFDSSFVQLYFCCFTGSLMGYFLGFLLKFDQRWIAFSVAAALTVNFTFFFFFFLSLSTESQRIPQAPHWTLWRLASESWRSRSSEETDTSVWSAWYEHTACWTSHSKPPMPKRDGNECTLTPAQSRFLRLQWRCKSRHYRDIGKTKDLNPVKYILLCTTLQEECFPLFLNFFPLIFSFVFFPVHVFPSSTELLL